MKKTVLFLAFVVFGLCVRAQEMTPITEPESQKVIAALTETAGTMQTMQCRFVQQKNSSMLTEPTISEGVMYYAVRDKMRWEYTAPYAFALVVNQDRIVKVTDGKAEKLDGRSGRMYQGMVNLIMGSASGKNLFDDASFEVALYDADPFWQAVMTPKRRDMKRMFKQLVFRFDKQTHVISQVELVEAGNDVTLIRFEEIKLNETIADEIFQ